MPMEHKNPLRPLILAQLEDGCLNQEPSLLDLLTGRSETWRLLACPNRPHRLLTNARLSLHKRFLWPIAILN